jgi:deoxyribonuclease-4
LFEAVPDNAVTVCLETTAGQGSVLGRTFEELAAIIERVDREDQVGVCIDTCHVFAAGYPLAPPGRYRQTMGLFEEILGFDRLKVMHLNDSKQGLGSRKDRHEHIGEGEIGLEGFRSVVNDPRLRGVPMILETPKGKDLSEDRANLKRLRSLVRGRRRRTGG